MKKLICLVLCFTLIFSFAGCADSEQDKARQDYEEFSADLEAQKALAVNARVEEDSKGQKYLTADVKNTSYTKISNIVLTFVVWNYKGEPVVIKTKSTPNNKNHAFQMRLPQEVEIPAGETWQGIGGIFLHKNCPSIKYVKAIVVSCKMGVSSYSNPYYSKWKATFVNKTLEDYQK